MADRYNRDGDSCTFIGNYAGVPSGVLFQNLNNANGFGSNAIARSSNTMILGSNSVKVGIGLSNDITAANGPTNKLEIDAGLNLTAAQPTGLAGASGLRFRDLHLGNTPSAANGVVLTVDTNGDVILVPSGGGGLGAGYCNTLTQLIGNSAGYDLNTNNFYFDGNGSGNALQNNVVIGNNCSYTPNAKLDVFQNAASSGSNAVLITNVDNDGNGITLNVTGGGTTHTAILSTSTGGSGTNNGIISTAANGTMANAGVFKSTGGSTSNIGIVTTANGGTTNTGLQADVNSIGIQDFGIAARAIGASTNYGGKFSAPSTAGINYGIYAIAAPVPITSTNYAGFFNGNVVRIGSDNFSSDANLKQNIDSISSALSIIAQLYPKTFYFDTTAHSNMSLPREKQYGFVAQDVEPILPELVGTAVQPAEYDSLNNIIIPALTFKTLNYNAFIAILMKGMQEQQRQIDSLRTQMNSCCASNSRIQNPNFNQTDVTLTNVESVVLNQNVPNPFAEQTTITYNLPESVKKAQLLFYDATGKLIKAVDLTGRGNGQINVFANDLSNGIYSYALVVDGQIADTKRMVKTN